MVNFIIQLCDYKKGSNYLSLKSLLKEVMICTWISVQAAYFGDVTNTYLISHNVLIIWKLTIDKRIYSLTWFGDFIRLNRSNVLNDVLFLPIGQHRIHLMPFYKYKANQCLLVLRMQLYDMVFKYTRKKRSRVASRQLGND